jgi:hypothetical protein
MDDTPHRGRGADSCPAVRRQLRITRNRQVRSKGNTHYGYHHYGTLRNSRKVQIGEKRINYSLLSALLPCILFDFLSSCSALSI